MTDRDTLLMRELRDTFDTLASAYTPVRLPDDLWTSARAQRRTDRVRVLAAVAVVIALLGGLVAVQQGSGALLPAKTSESGALPKNVYVPSAEEVADLMARDPRATRNYEGGRAAIATLTAAGEILLVSATTGEHHIISELDVDLIHGSGGNLPLALSPDGRKLAYAYRERSDDSVEEETGVGVIDLLESGLGGVMLPLAAPDGLSIEIDDLAWSPDSSHVAWLGSRYVPGQGPIEYDTKWLGSGDVNLDGARQWSLETERGTWPSEIVVDDRGRGFVIGDEAWPFGEDPDLSAIPADSGRAFPVDEDWHTTNDRGATLTADRRTLLLGGPNATGGKRGATTTHLEVDLASPDLTSTRTDWPMDSESGGTYLEMLGETPDGSVVATQNFTPTSIEAVTPDGDFRRLTTIHGFTEVSLTVATDLADADPVRFAAPAWAPRPPLWPLVGVLVLVLAALAVVVRRRRHRPEGRTETRTGSGAREVVAWTVVLLVLLGALTHVSRPWPSTTSVRSAAGSVPTTVHLPPDYLSLYDVEPSNLDVGRIGALAQSSGQPAVLVGAEDGHHRAVALDGQLDDHGRMSPSTTVLSPDGTRLVWVFNDDEDFIETAQGLRIADLGTGEVEDVRIAGEDDKPLRVDEIVWSPSGTHVAWLGTGPLVKKNSRGEKNRRSQEVGVVTLAGSGSQGLAATQWRLTDSARSSAAIGVDDAGRARVLAGRRLWTLPEPSRAGGGPTSRQVAGGGQSWTGAAISPDGRQFVTGLNHGEGDEYVSGLMTLDLTAPDSRMVTHPWRDLPLGAASRVLGWTPEGDVVVTHHLVDLGGQWSDQQVSVVTDSGTATPLTGIDATHMTVSVASDLASNPMEFPEPIWPRSDERWWALALLGVAALGAALMLGQTVRRRTPRGNRNTAPRV
ncbi:hypothetical protein [Nocardioides gilvus]|uniref:hypothetical protein n=1 Tax=Nocardioides gilvus TaxID=1735589 RepID=UPI000D74055E|nr:hypothetical protein [Nocardioides gilvus]